MGSCGRSLTSSQIISIDFRSADPSEGCAWIFGIFGVPRVAGDFDPDVSSSSFLPSFPRFVCQRVFWFLASFFRSLGVSFKRSQGSCLVLFFSCFPFLRFSPLPRTYRRQNTI